MEFDFSVISNLLTQIGGIAVITASAFGLAEYVFRWFFRLIFKDSFLK